MANSTKLKTYPPRRTFHRVWSNFWRSAQGGSSQHRFGAVPRKLERSSHEAVTQICKPSNSSCARPPPLWETARERDCCKYYQLPVYIETLSCLTWEWRFVTQQMWKDFQPIPFATSVCEAVTGRLFYGRWGSELWYESPGFARQPIWS